MSDRLAELRRQRAMVAEQLAWLDREIAATGEKASAPTPAKVPSAPPFQPAPVSAPTVAPATAAAVPIPLAVPPITVAPEVAAAADAILDEYRVQPDALRTDVKKGCFLYFAAAMALLAAGVATLYFALRKN